MTKNEIRKERSLNVHLYQSTFLHETRMLKITRSLAQHRVFDRFLILARHEDSLPYEEQIDAQRAVRRVPTWIRRRGGLVSKILSTLEWLTRVTGTLLFQPVSCVNCHSLMVLPIGVLLKILKRTTLIYDTHELETETGHLRGFRQRLAKWTERTCIRWADETIVVGDGIAHWYRSAYPGLSVHTVRNLPYRSERLIGTSNRYFREHFGIPDNAVIFLYQGVLGEGRGVPLLLEVFAKLSESHHLVFMGYGEFEADIQQAASKQSNIHLHPAVPPEQLSQYTSGADVGICLIERMCLSYYLSLPNKLFEYLQSGIPVVASAFPEMGAIIKAQDCGWTTELDADQVLQTVAAIDHSQVKAKRVGVAAARGELTWECEEERLLSVYARWLTASHSGDLAGTSSQKVA